MKTAGAKRGGLVLVLLAVGLIVPALLAQGAGSITVMVSAGGASPNPLAVGDTMTASLSATASNVPMSTAGCTVGSPTWAWSYTIQYASQIGQWGPAPGGYSVSIDPSPSTNPTSTTLTAQFNQAGYWRIAVTAQVTYTDTYNNTWTGTGAGAVIMATSVGVQNIQYQLPNGGGYVDASGTLFVLVNHSVNFKAVPAPTGARFPAGKPVWGGSSGASGTGAAVSVAFGTLSSSRSDYQTVTATCGTASVTVHAIVFDLRPILTPEDNFDGRDLDNYGVCELIDLSYQTTPSGISASDIGGLQWQITRGGGTLTGGSGGVGTYQCPDVAAIIVLSLLVTGGPMVGEKKDAPAKNEEAGMPEPPQKQIRSLRERIDALRQANDVGGLRQLLTEAKTKWLADVTKGSEYYPVILDLCLAVNSVAPTRPELRDAMRDLTVSVIDSPSEKSPEIKGKFLLLLEGDPEYDRGRLRGEEWVKERGRRTKRWLSVWKSIREHLAAMPEPGPRYMYASPPRETGLPNGVAPSAIKDPVLRKRYEDAIERNKRNIEASQKKRNLAEFEKRFAGRAKRQLLGAYSKPPFQTDELKKLLTESAFDAKARAEIAGEVKKREAAWAEQEAKKPPPPHVQTTEPVPPPDGLPHHADPRFRVKVSSDLTNPLVDAILAELSRATGVALSRADDVQDRYPVAAVLGVHTFPAWQVMDNLAASKRVEGRWEKENDGYRLVRNGNSVVIPEASEDQGGTPSSRHGPLILIAAAGLVVILCLVYGWVRRYRRRL